MANIKDVAKKAGVSISTVSYALNGSDKVAPQTKARIEAIAKELNYIPNAVGRNLKQKETKMIGTFINDYTGLHFFGPILKGMRDVLNEKGYELIVCSGVRSHLFIPEGIVDGAIILDKKFTDEDLLNYADRGRKLVVMDRKLEHPNINQVLLNNEGGIVQAVDYAYEQGHRNLYYIKGSEDEYDGRTRLESIRKTTKRYTDLAFHELLQNKPIDEMMGELLSSYDTPICIVCFNDELAIKIHHYISKTDFEVGKEVHLIGFDNIEMTQLIQPALTTVNIPNEQWGIETARNLLDMISGKKVTNSVIEVNLIKRNSVQRVNESQL